MATQISLNDGAIASAGALAIQTNGTTQAVSISTGQVATLAKDAVIQGVTVGRGAGAVATNTAVGASALAANTSGDKSSVFGYQAANATTTGEATVFGYQSGLVNTTGAITALGRSTLAANTAGNYNTAVGSFALVANTTASNNTAVGYQAGYSTTTGTNNVIMGYQAGYSNTTGAYNTFVGVSAGNGSNFNGNAFNTCIGFNSGTSLTTGIKNTFIGGGGGGIASGAVITTGSANTIVGNYNGNAGSLDIRTLSNYIVLSDGDGNVPLYLDGSGGGRPWFRYSGANRAIVNNTDASTPFGILSTYTAATPNGTSNEFLFCSDATATRATIRSNGGLANYSANDVNLSDRREKTNFAPAKSYLDVICAIPVQTFNYIDQNMEDDGGLTLGVVAQDVQAVAPEMVMESNWAKADDEPKMRLSIYQTDLQYALMKCIQELKAEVDSLKAQINGASA